MSRIFRKQNFLFLFLALIFFQNCATTERVFKPKKTRPPHITHLKEQKSSQDVSAPVLSLVSQGLQAYKTKDYDLAEWRFEEAIALDSKYGPAYYWLARVKFRLEEPDRSLELLETARVLLSDDDRWLRRIEDFAEHIRSKEFLFDK